MLLVILSFILTIVLHTIYHKMFRVVYFSFQRVIVEWVGCYMISMFLLVALGVG